MTLIGYFKGEPTEYILRHRGGRMVGHGAGITFFYNTWNTSISLVPINTVDANFIFNETTGNFQVVAIQGQLTYRVADPVKLASLLNFTVEPSARRYLSKDPEKLAQRIINAVQIHTRNQILGLSLEETLKGSENLAQTVLKAVKSDPLILSMGVDVLAVHVTSVKPTPEMAKALEAEYREALQRKADDAIYARRAAAVEAERKIQENELSTKIALEQQRAELVDLEGDNMKKEADFAAAAVSAKLAPYASLDPRQLMAMGIREMGEKAEHIGSLTLTPELLAAIRDAH